MCCNYSENVIPAFHQEKYPSLEMFKESHYVKQLKQNVVKLSKLSQQLQSKNITTCDVKIDLNYSHQLGRGKELASQYSEGVKKFK